MAKNAAQELYDKSAQRTVDATLDRAIVEIVAERDRLRAALGRIADQTLDREKDPTGSWAWSIDIARHALRTEDIIGANRRADEPGAGT